MIRGHETVTDQTVGALAIFHHVPLPCQQTARDSLAAFVQIQDQGTFELRPFHLRKKHRYQLGHTETLLPQQDTSCGRTYRADRAIGYYVPPSLPLAIRDDAVLHGGDEHLHT